MAVLLMTEPSGARLPRGKQTVLVIPRWRARAGERMTSLGSTPSHSRSRWRSSLATLALLPGVQHFAQRTAGDGQHLQIEQARFAQMQHHFGHSAGQKHAHRGMSDRPVRQGIDKARDAAVDVVPIFDRRPPQAGGMGDGRHVQQQIGRAPASGMDDHRVADRGLAQNGRERHLALGQVRQCPRAAASHVDPNRLAAGGQGRVRQRHAERLADDLAGGRRAEKLATAARAGTSLAT